MDPNDQSQPTDDNLNPVNNSPVPDQPREGDSLIPPLPQDNDTPFSPPTDPVDDATVDVDLRTQAGQIDDTHPATDSASDIDSTQAYNEGLSGAAEAGEDSTGNGIAGYDPEADKSQAEN